MKTEIITIALVMMIALAGAETIIAGNSYSFESEQFEYYDIIGNASSTEGMDVNWDNGNITISFSIAYRPDTFTLIFYNNESEVVVEHHYHSSGSGGSSGRRIIYRDRNIATTVPEYITKEVTIPLVCEPEIEVVDKIPLWGYLLMALAGLIVLVALIKRIFGKDDDDAIVEDDDTVKDEFEDIDEEEFNDKE